MAAVDPLAITLRGEIFGIAVGTRLEANGDYTVVVPPEEWENLQALCTHLQSLDGCRYDSEFDRQLRLAIDTLAEIREHAPKYGQLRLNGL